MTSVRRRTLLGGAVACLVPSVARADEATANGTASSASPPPSPEPVAPGIGDAPLRAPIADRDRTEAANYVITMPGTDVITGGAAIDVRAPLADVRKIIGSFHRYKEILPRIQQSRVVAENGGTSDVYLRAPILGGLAALWGVARFKPFQPYKSRGIELAGTLVDGNIDDWQGRWMAFPCGEKRTLLKLEIYCRPSIPIPSRIINKWTLWACLKGVTAVRDMAECGTSSVAKD